MAAGDAVMQMQSRLLPPTRRGLLTGIAASGLLGGGAAAQNDALAWPVRQVRLLIPAAAGGGQDVFWRIIAERLGRRLRATFIVENKAGAGGVLGSQEVAAAPADGATLLCTSSSIALLSSFYRNLSFDPEQDLVPISLLCDLPGGVMVRADSSIRDLADLIARAKAQPGRLTYGSGGVGTSSQLSAALFLSMAGIEVLHVPYRGVFFALNALYAGDTDFVFAATSELLPHVRKGRARALGTTMMARIPSLPDVPAIAELVPGFQVISWFAMFAPKGFPPQLVERLAAELAILREDQDLKARIGEAGAIMRLDGPRQLATRLSEDTATWRAVIVRENIRPD